MVKANIFTYIIFRYWSEATDDKVLKLKLVKAALKLGEIFCESLSQLITNATSLLLRCHEYQLLPQRGEVLSNENNAASFIITPAAPPQLLAPSFHS